MHLNVYILSIFIHMHGVTSQLQINVRVTTNFTTQMIEVTNHQKKKKKTIKLCIYWFAIHNKISRIFSIFQNYVIISGLYNEKGLCIIFLTSKKVSKILDKQKLNPIETIKQYGKKEYFEVLIFVNQYPPTQQIINISHLISHMTKHQIISVFFLTPKSKLKIKLQLFLTITMHCLSKIK